MSKTSIRDAIVAELAKLGAGEQGDKKALRAAIGCSAAELDGAIDALRFTGKIGFYALVLAPSMRTAPPEPPVAIDAMRASMAPAPAPVVHVEQARPEGIEADAGVGLGEAKKDDPARPEADLAASPPPTGAALLAEIRGYCGRVGASQIAFSRAAVGYAGLLANLSKHNPSPATAAKVRAFIAANPDRLPAAAPAAPDAKHYMPPAPPVAAQVHAEAAEAGERRARAGVAGGGSGAPLSATSRPAVEAIQSEAVATPSDLMLAIYRRHPALMRRAVDLSRARGTTPAAALYSALERGLDQLETRVVAP